MAGQNSTKFPHDLSGLTFNSWTVLHEIPFSEHGKKWQRYFSCKCKCGTIRTVHRGSLVRGVSTSCGCSRIGKKHACPGNIKHGLSRTRTYRIWIDMIRRCEDPRDKYFCNYGGRGIYVCDRWKSSFEAFVADMGVRPSKKHSIDRIDNDGPYSPDNCCWATRSEQMRNTRQNRLITYKGETKCLTEWAEITGVTCDALKHRLNRGWPVDKALETPVAQRNRRHAAS